jgi:hypothetical protein
MNTTELHRARKKAKKKTESGGGGIPDSNVGRLDAQHNTTPGYFQAGKTFSNTKQAMCQQSRRNGQENCTQ